METPHDQSSEPQNVHESVVEESTEPQIIPYKKVIEDEFIDMSFIQNLIAVPLTEDKGVIKYIEPNKQENSTQESSNKPKSLARCGIRFEGRTENGELVEKERPRKEIKGFKLNYDNMIRGMHYATASLDKDETSWFRFTPEYHFGVNGVPGVVEPNTILYYKIELVHFKNEVGQLQNDDYEGRVALFTETREKGNEFFKNKEYDKAFKEYKKGADILNNIPKILLSKITEEQTNILKDFKLKFTNNAAIACIKLNKYSEGLKYVNKVLELDPRNAKALFRKGQCEMELGNYEQARRSFEESIEAGNPEKNECLRNINYCQRTRKTAKKDEGKVYQQIFQKMAAEEEKELAEKKLQEKIERKKERERQKNDNSEKTEDKDKSIQKDFFDVKQLLEGAVFDSKNLNVQLAVSDVLNSPYMQPSEQQREDLVNV